MFFCVCCFCPILLAKSPFVLFLCLSLSICHIHPCICVRHELHKIIHQFIYSVFLVLFRATLILLWMKFSDFEIAFSIEWPFELFAFYLIWIYLFIECFRYGFIFSVTLFCPIRVVVFVFVLLSFLFVCFVSNNHFDNSFNSFGCSFATTTQIVSSLIFY